MTDCNTAYIGNYGLDIIFQVVSCRTGLPVDISNAVNMEITLRKPSRELSVKKEPDVKFVSDGTDGLVHYVVQKKDLDEIGPWDAQFDMGLSAGDWTTSETTFNVRSKLNTNRITR